LLTCNFTADESVTNAVQSDIAAIDLTNAILDFFAYSSSEYQTLHTRHILGFSVFDAMNGSGH
jgi:hypothetical protein